MTLDYNCAYHDRICYSLEEIVSKIIRLPCDSLSFKFQNCPFPADSFRHVVNAVTYRVLNCVNYIVDQFPHIKNSYIKIAFDNTETNTLIGLEQMRYITEAAHLLSKNFSQISTHAVNFIISFEKNAVLKDAASHLLTSCPNIKVFYNPNGFLGRRIEPDGYWMGIVVKDVYDQSRFYTIVSSVGANSSECLFNQLSNNDLQTASELNSNSVTQYNAALSPVALFGLAVASVFGVLTLGKYLYNYFTFQNKIDTTDGSVPETECLDLAQDYECLGRKVEQEEI